MKIRNEPSNQIIRIWLATILGMMVSATAFSAFAASTDCTPHPIDAAAKNAIILFLKTKYGDAYVNYDVDFPSMVNLAGGPGSKAPPDNSYALGFDARKDRRNSEPVTPIVIEFERCTNKIVGSFELHPSKGGQKPEK